MQTIMALTNQTQLTCNCAKNGAHANVTNNDDTGVVLRGNTEASELHPSTSPTDTNAQSTMEALAEDCNSVSLLPMSIAI